LADFFDVFLASAFFPGFALAGSASGAGAF
jgi:hypothetical protein